MSYVHNDRVAYYGDRSVLNYRRIPVSDPDEKRYRIEMLEPCLVESVDRLLSNEIPVYYVEDKTPSLWGSLDILRNHFELEKIADAPVMYRLAPSEGSIGGSDDSAPISCPSPS
jgi:hypothetical protein